jgi:preprotein translocase subunit SecG
MQTVIIVVHLLIVLALIGVVLLQRSEGGLGLGGGGGGGVGGFMTGRGQANALTRATAILATAFFVTSLVLGIMAHRGSAPRSIFDGAAPASGSSAPAQQPGGSEPIQLGTPPASSGTPATPATPSVPQSR